MPQPKFVSVEPAWVDVGVLRGAILEQFQPELAPLSITTSADEPGIPTSWSISGDGAVHEVRKLMSIARNSQ